VCLQGFTKEITMPREQWVGYIKDYDGGTLMEYVIHPKMPYADLVNMFKARHLCSVPVLAAGTSSFTVIATLTSEHARLGCNCTYLTCHCCVYSPECTSVKGEPGQGGIAMVCHGMNARGHNGSSVFLFACCLFAGAARVPGHSDQGPLKQPHHSPRHQAAEGGSASATWSHQGDCSACPGTC